MLLARQEGEPLPRSVLRSPNRFPSRLLGSIMMQMLGGLPSCGPLGRIIKNK